MIHPLSLYAEGLVGARDRQRPGTDHRLRLQDGTVVPLPLHRYLGRADRIDEKLLKGVRGPVLDVGSDREPSPRLGLKGRIRARRRPLAGSRSACHRPGGEGIVASIFDELPGDGQWTSALLLDGNIGIGGAPERLLTRIAALLCDHGELLVELDSPTAPTSSTIARIETDRSVSSWFPWARVSVRDLDFVARSGGFEVGERWCDTRRWFARLRRAEVSRSLAGRA